MYEKAHKLLHRAATTAAPSLLRGARGALPVQRRGAPGAARPHLRLLQERASRKSAIDAADQFIRENPTHPRVDYAITCKGLVYFERTPNFLERWFNADLTSARRRTRGSRSTPSRQLVKQLPEQRCTRTTARQRMIFLRNRLADYEVYVASLLPEARRLRRRHRPRKYCIENYDGAPAVKQALADHDRLLRGPRAQGPRASARSVPRRSRATDAEREATAQRSTAGSRDWRAFQSVRIRRGGSPT